MSRPLEPTEDCQCDSDDYEYIDVFGIGSLTDTHMESDLTEEELAKRVNEAIENTKRMGGQISSAISGELGNLIAPKMTWEDFAVISLGNKKQGIGANNWSSPRIRSLFSGMYLPKKKTVHFTALILVDRSGSVSDEQANYGLSQIQVLGERIEGYVVCFDTNPFYDEMTRIENGSAEELLKVKYVGGGGTCIASSLYSYEGEIGPVDIVIIITDGQIFDMNEVNEKGAPNHETQYLWLLTERCPEFSPGFGRVFNLQNDRI